MDSGVEIVIFFLQFYDKWWAYQAPMDGSKPLIAQMAWGKLISYNMKPKSMTVGKEFGGGGGEEGR